MNDVSIPKSAIGSICLVLGWCFSSFSPVFAQSVAETFESTSVSLPSTILPAEDQQTPLARYLELAQEQVTPGLGYSRSRSEIPAYLYTNEYYNRDYGGIRPTADYAPTGYYPRDQQEGPADPEYWRLYPPPQLTAEEREKFSSPGYVPGSILVPGTNTSVLFRGFLRLAGLYDFEPIGVNDAFVTNSIPIPQQDGTNLNLSARISRFSIETWTPTDVCDWTVHTRIEGDFFNGPDQAAGGGGNPFRLRHAYADFGPFRLGQQNTTFMDASSWPSLVDFQGPNSWVNQRQPSVRITLPVAKRTYWAASVERPFSDIATNNQGSAVQDVPDLANHIRYQGDLGHLQIGGLLRTIGYRRPGDDVTRRAGAGISGSCVYHPWAFLLGTDPISDPSASGLTRSRTIMQATWGSGIGRYLNDLPNQRTDGQVNPLTGDFDLVRASGWNTSYEHWFNQSWLSNVTYGNVSVDNHDDQPADAFNGSQYAAASLWWIPVPRMAVAIEYMWGERENLDGQTGRAQRLHSMFQYNF